MVHPGYVLYLCHWVRYGDGAGNTVENSSVFSLIRMASCLQCFDTVGWRQEGHPACKKMGNGGGGHWLIWM